MLPLSNCCCDLAGFYRAFRKTFMLSWVIPKNCDYFSCQPIKTYYILLPWYKYGQSYYILYVKQLACTENSWFLSKISCNSERFLRNRSTEHLLGSAPGLLIALIKIGLKKKCWGWGWMILQYNMDIVINYVTICFSEILWYVF